MVTAGRFWATLIFVFSALLLVGYLSLVVGPTSSDLAYAITEIRLPRFLTAVLLGASLGLAGLLIQLATNNPLSEPELLGINQSAVFAVILGLVIWGDNLPTGGIFLAALLGGTLSGVAILMMTVSGAFPRDRLILAGLTIAFFFGSAGHGLLLMKDSDLFEILHWVAGKLSGADWSDVRVVCVIFVPALLLSIRRASDWNLLELGDDTARNLGVDPVARRLELVALTVVLCATCVALAGPIGFVGIIVPHLARYLAGISYLRRLPMSLALGALLVAASDLVARWIVQPTEIPVGVLTALVGAPYFLYRAQKA